MNEKCFSYKGAPTCMTEVEIQRLTGSAVEKLSLKIEGKYLQVKGESNAIQNT